MCTIIILIIILFAFQKWQMSSSSHETQTDDAEIGGLKCMAMAHDDDFNTALLSEPFDFEEEIADKFRNVHV